MFSFSNKNVYLISTAKWGKMKVSKHHYAIELAKKGNQVYYIEPPDLTLKENMVVKRNVEVSNLHIVSYRPVYRGKRFLPEKIYNFLFKIQISQFKKHLKCEPDVVMCFDIDRFTDLRWFGADVSIMFMADLFKPGKLPSVIASADICFGVSDSIVELLEAHGRKAFFINHGLNDEFRQLALSELSVVEERPKPQHRLKAGYMGSLFMEALDVTIMQQVIEQNPEVDFVFWGQYQRNEDNMVAYEDEKIFAFIRFLKQQPNVFLRGPKVSKELMDEIPAIDLFWLCYYMKKNWLWDGSNSHKIMEYLSTGKPVVAHHVSTYKDKKLLYMLPGKDNDDYPALFKQVIGIINNGEDSALRKRRLEFALDNTYEQQVQVMESVINREIKKIQH